MFRIREEQLGAFRDYMLDHFVARTSAHLRKEFPAECAKHHLQGETLEASIREGIERAKGYGVKYEDDIELFLDCMAILGPDFDQGSKHPLVKTILQRKDMDGSEKMTEIEEYLIFSSGESP